MQEERISLYCKNATADKEYHVQLVAEGGGFMVYYQNGKRGGTLASGKKTPAPVDYDVALKKFKAVVKEKTSGGYSPGESGTAFVGTALEARFTGILPQLLNPISEEDVERYLTDPAYVLQEKKDGHRRLAQDTGSERLGINRKGLAVGLPQTVADALPVLGSSGAVLVDGELMGDVLWVFDVLELNGQDLRTLPYQARLDAMALLAERLRAAGSPGMRVVPTAYTESEKRALYAQLKAQSCEGGVFKRLDAAYEAGRPNSGGNQFKRKFMHSASFVVKSCHATKRSVGLSMLDAAGKVVSLGNCTIPSNWDIPAVGTVVEVVYLYAFPGGSVFQPQYKGPRDDIEAAECLTSQLHFKASTVDEDEEA